jgi:hypothetical protein
MANTKKSTEKKTENTTQPSSQELLEILEMMQSLKKEISSLKEENSKLKEDILTVTKSEETEIKEEYFAEVIPSNFEIIDDAPKKIKVYHMQELVGGTSTVIKLTNTKRKLRRMGELVTFDIDDFEELVGLYSHYFEKGILALDACHLDYAEMYDLPIYDNKTKAQYNSKILKDVVSYNYEKLQNFYNNLSQNNKIAFLTYWLGQVYEKKEGYYNMEKMRWLNTISNTNTFSVILTELENAERRGTNVTINADK